MQIWDALFAPDSQQGSHNYSPAEKRLFWIGLVANCGAWAALCFLEIFRLKFGEHGLLDQWATSYVCTPLTLLAACPALCREF